MRPTLARVLAGDLQPLLPRIQAPTLLTLGDRDRETPLELGERSGAARSLKHSWWCWTARDTIPSSTYPDRVANEVRAFLQRAGEGAA